MQDLFVHVAENGVVHFHHGGQRALAETGHRAQRIAAVGGSDAGLLGVVGLFGEPQFMAQALQQAARSARMAGRAPADADAVFALRFQVEQREESDHAVYLRQGDIGLFGYVFEDFGGKIFMRMMFLDGFQDS